MMFIGSFVILMATTIVYFLLYGKHKIEEEMTFFLKNYQEERADNYIRDVAELLAE